MKYYTYIHYRNDTNKPFYIGKGSTVRYKSKGKRSKWWNSIADKHGFHAEILAHWPTEQEAYEHEILLIECFRKMGTKLVNVQKGGDGGIDHSSKISGRPSKLKGRVRPNITLAHTGKKRPARSKLMTEKNSKRKWFNNGIKNIFVEPTVIPDGFVMGRLTPWQ
jgi:hypothetical protein